MFATRAGVTRPVPSGLVAYVDIHTLATQNADLGDITDASIVVNGNFIAWVGKTAEIPAEYAPATRVSLAGLVVVPGLVNTHHHMFQTLTRCVAEDDFLFGWLETLIPVWSRMQGSDVYKSAKLAMAELILSGCTTSSDHLYLYPNDVSLDDTIRAARELGLRFHPTRGIVTRGKSAGGLPPDDVAEDGRAALADAERLIKELHDPSPGSMLRVGVAPCSPFTTEMSVMRGAAELAARHPHVRLHTHLAENDEDIAYSEKTYGCRPGEYLKQCGWDEGGRAWFAHCVKLDEAETALFADKGLGVAHCPASNARLGSGIAPVRELLDGGVNVGLGVDGSASNDGGNLAQEARLALLLQRARLGAKGITVRQTLEVATKGGAANLGRQGEIGELAPGFLADFVGWMVPGTLAFAGSSHAPIQAILLCDVGKVHTSVINGERIVADGELLTADLKNIIDEHNDAALKLCATIGQ